MNKMKSLCNNYNKCSFARFYAVLVLLFMAWTVPALAQTDYSGVYYIGSVGYDASTPANNYYLCPTEGWCFYAHTNDFTGTDNGMPFLTTYKCQDGVYDVRKAVWIIEKAPAPNDAYYYIKQALTGRYLTSNGTIRTTNNADRMRVHLEAPENLDDKELFTIDFSDGDDKYYISPKGVVGGASDRIWLVVNGGNKNALTGQSGKTGGPTGYENTAGIIGVYTKTDNNAPFYLEEATPVTPAPTITNNFDGTITITGTGTIYYTTDGTEPTTSSSTYSSAITLTDAITVIKAMAKDGSNYESMVVTYELPKCETPVITISNGTVSITSTTEGASIRYTTDNTTPTSSSTLYNLPFPLGNISVIRAIAVKTGWAKSDEAYYMDFATVSSSNEITNMHGFYRLASGFNSIDAIGSSSEPFGGVIDGQMYTISGLDHPLVAYADGATIKNVILDNVSISSGTNVGAICNEATGASRIYNCGILSGEVGGSNYVGGIVGLLDDESRVINCFSYATITDGECVAGIVGYNNKITTASDIKTMVMNCMFYGDITGGTTVSPVYGGNNIANLQGGLNTFNYYSYEKLQTKEITEHAYNSALAVEEKFLNRFEFYRLLLNSNKKLAAFYATGSVEDAGQMLKWVLETADRTIDNPKPYPILKQQDYYPSIINPDFEHAPDSSATCTNQGGKLGKTLSVTISGVGSNAPEGASITTGSLTLPRTDKDFDRFNFNYDKVQLPYYNDVGTGNYTGNRVVTGWKITAIDPVPGDPYTSANYDYDKSYSGVTGNNPVPAEPEYFDYPNYNFADRKSSNKDLYSVSGRIFSQGAYFDVPYGVSTITIEPYWANACYIADPNYDLVYDASYANPQNVTQTGVQATPGTTTFNGGQRIENTVASALSSLNGATVYDNAVVLVGNLHLSNVPSNGNKPFTMMSVDMDNDHEPDYSLIYHHKGRTSISPIRYDFLNIPGTAQAQRPNGADLICNFTIFKTKGWFECTNTAFFYTSQIEYENLKDTPKTNAPFILLGGVADQFVSTQSNEVPGKTIYIHVGGNAWIYSFGMGTHGDGSKGTPHVPVSVTGGEYPTFYLTGTYNPDADIIDDNAECYISGGRFGELAGACQEQIGNTTNGNVRWQIYNADITDFFGGGLYDAKPVKGHITTEIFNSRVGTFCGGPKFGNMQTGKNVTTTAEGCVFGQYFGAGYGGLSYSKKKYYDKDDDPVDWAGKQRYYTGDRGKYYDGHTSGLGTNNQYGFKGIGVATDFEYEYFVWSTGKTGGRFYVNFASFSLAQCNDVQSTLKKCTINGNFYGGGSLGKVVGTATSILDGCMVNGNVFGAGFSASLQPIAVRDAGFTKYPKYNKESGMFEPGVLSGMTPFEWQQVASYPSNGGNGFIDGNHVITTQDLSKTNLGSVQEVSLTISGNSTVLGNVFGGGDESVVGGNISVTLQGRTNVHGNVYGGGNKGVVEGNTSVIIQDTAP